ncbi:MAG: nucleotidyl transferase AbiEii/AbiGii toxin family protein [Gemmatimonadaceae bacterium]
MIGKQDILERAREWQLRPDVVEKDYVLGWLLAAIAQHEETSDGWVLKGGTCVKKCFFETYRFSEDLDFSLLPEAAYSEANLREVLTEISDLVREWSGIEFSADALAVRARLDRQGRTTFEGKVGYRGPLAVPGWPRVLFDLTRHEPVVDEPVLRPVLHPYPDDLPADSLVHTYSMEELVAEKVRALYERCRPRDLYDVVYVLGDSSHGLDLPHAREVFEEKCAAKQLACPSLSEIIALVDQNDELRAEWANMLAHQLPQLPPIDGMLARVGEALAWLTPVPVAVAVAPPTLAAPAAEAIVAPDSTHVWRSAVPLEAVRFAGTNHLLVRFVYSGKTRTLEPYSLRRSGRGNLLLYGWELESGQIKAFDDAKISQLSITDQSFTPRYRVEFAPGAALTAPMLASVPRVRRTATRPSRVRPHSGPTYVYVCPVCSREFRHQRRDPALRWHKTRDGGWYCSGRRGHLTRVE